MNANKVLAIIMLVLACVLAILAIALLAFIPFATETEDALGPLAGSIIFCVSAIALVLDSREFLTFRAIPRAPRILLHSVNVVAILLVGILVIPSVLQDVVYRLETRALMFVGLTLIVAYFLAAKMRHTDRP